MSGHRANSFRTIEMAPFRVTRRERVTLAASMFVITLAVALYVALQKPSRERNEDIPQNSDQPASE